MGGLRGKLPITFCTMVMAWLAIAGIFPFAGFVSKDEILWQAFSNPVHPAVFNKIVYAIGLVAAALTAIYMTRLMMMAFFTASRMDHEVEHHAHESPWTMTVPLIILAVLSVVGGFLNWPKAPGRRRRLRALAGADVGADRAAHAESISAARSSTA